MIKKESTVKKEKKRKSSVQHDLINTHHHSPLHSRGIAVGQYFQYYKIKEGLEKNMGSLPGILLSCRHVCTRMPECPFPEIPLDKN